MITDKNTMIKVINKYNGTVGYEVPEMGVYRNFYPGEEKEISFEELERLSYVPGGDVILKEFLEVKSKEAINQIFHFSPEPEYHYSREDVKKLMLEGTLDQFLDCLDFAPEVIKENIKEMAVSLPLNDMAKRDAIREKLGFDVTRAIEIENTKLDGQTEKDAEAEKGIHRRAARRAAPISESDSTKAAAPTGRRYKPTEK